MRVPVCSLLIDFDLYPRATTDSQHVHYLAEALAAGATLPPIVVDKKTRKVVDGVHRCKAHLRHFGVNAEIEIVERSFANDKEMFLESIKLNAPHGRKLDRHDRVHCAIVGRRFGLTDRSLAAAMSMHIERFKDMIVDRTAFVGVGNEPVALKSAVAGVLGGQKITREQEAALPRVGGNRIAFYVNQVVLFIEHDFIDTNDAKLLERMEVLLHSVQKFLKDVNAKA